MHWYQTAILCGYLAAIFIAWRVPRAVLWAGLLALSFVVSSWWHDAGLPYGAAFGASTNVAIGLLIYAIAEKRYEMRIWNCLHLMIVIDILYLAGWIASHTFFAIALELANWLAILVIGAAGLLERAGYGMGTGRHRYHFVDSFRRALHSERRVPPWWQDA